jgi:hypothetical protein
LAGLHIHSIGAFRLLERHRPCAIPVLVADDAVLVRSGQVTGLVGPYVGPYVGVGGRVGGHVGGQAI